MTSSVNSRGRIRDAGGWFNCVVKGAHPPAAHLPWAAADGRLRVHSGRGDRGRGRRRLLSAGTEARICRDTPSCFRLARPDPSPAQQYPDAVPSQKHTKVTLANSRTLEAAEAAQKEHATHGVGNQGVHVC